MEFEQLNNAELLSSIAGKQAAEELLQRYGGLTALAQASFDELTEIQGIGDSKAKAIKSAFLLAQRLSRETYLEAPLLDSPERVADLLGKKIGSTQSKTSRWRFSIRAAGFYRFTTSPRGHSIPCLFILERCSSKRFRNEPQPSSSCITIHPGTHRHRMRILESLAI
jgi:hypothetical protein